MLHVFAEAGLPSYTLTQESSTKNIFQVIQKSKYEVFDARIRIGLRFAI